MWGRTAQQEEYKHTKSYRVHTASDPLLAKVDPAAGPHELGLLFQVLVGDLCPELGDLLLQVRAPAQV